MKKAKAYATSVSVENHPEKLSESSYNYYNNIKSIIIALLFSLLLFSLVIMYCIYIYMPSVIAHTHKLTPESQYYCLRLHVYGLTIRFNPKFMCDGV